MDSPSSERTGKRQTAVLSLLLVTQQEAATRKPPPERWTRSARAAARRAVARRSVAGRSCGRPRFIEEGDGVKGRRIRWPSSPIKDRAAEMNMDTKPFTPPPSASPSRLQINYEDLVLLHLLPHLGGWSVDGSKMGQRFTMRRLRSLVACLQRLLPPQYGIISRNWATLLATSPSPAYPSEDMSGSHCAFHG